MPPSWLDTVTVTDILIACAALILVLMAVVAVVKVVHPLMVKLTRMLDAFIGVKGQPGVPDRPGVMERLDQQDTAIRDIKEQVTPNHGSTSKLAEDVQDIAAGLAQLTQRFDDHMGQSSA